jgi:hypothetical protein
MANRAVQRGKGMRNFRIQSNATAAPGEPLQGDVLAPNTAWTYSWRPFVTSLVWVVGGF